MPPVLCARPVERPWSPPWAHACPGTPAARLGPRALHGAGAEADVTWDVRRPRLPIAVDAESIRRAIAAAEQDRVPRWKPGHRHQLRAAPLPSHHLSWIRLGGMSTQLGQARGSEGPSACMLSRSAWAGRASCWRRVTSASSRFQ